ncbi:DUF397 domain-containing protein [Streptomyces sp. NPDC050121]|uniref:DUF397 domain-containing protein n=1 Tax=Streptomyces sp. NPDC050121 TaxID=3365601 RepID=UPI0037B84C8E
MAVPLKWQKSSFSGGGEGNDCLELASTSTTLHLRESDTPAIALTSTPATFVHFLAGIRTDALTRQA